MIAADVRAFLLLAKLRIVDVTRSGAASFLFLGVPVLLLVIVGVVFAHGHPFERRQVAIVVAEGAPTPPAWDALAPRPEVRLSREPSAAAAEAKLRARMLNAVGVDAPGAPPIIRVGPREELFGRGLATVLPPGATVDVVELPRWGYVHYLVPGMLTFTTMIAGLFGMGYAMVRYRQNLFLKKLATTPLPRWTFIGSNIVGRGTLALMQMAVVLCTAWAAFAMPVSLAAAAWLLALTALGVLVFMGMGFVIACAIKNEAVLIDGINSVVMPVVLLSEIFFPVDELPSPLPAVAGALPSTQMVRLTRAVLLLGETRPAALLPGLLVVALWTVVTFGVSLALFRWHE